MKKKTIVDIFIEEQMVILSNLKWLMKVIIHLVSLFLIDFSYRALSGYTNKILFTNHYLNRMPHLYSQMLTYTKLSPSAAREFLRTQMILNGTKHLEIKNLFCTSNIKFLKDETFNQAEAEHLKKPSFRGFVLGIASTILVCKGDVECLANIEIHYRTQNVKCSPCEVNYDAIVKVTMHFILS